MEGEDGAPDVDLLLLCGLFDFAIQLEDALVEYRALFVGESLRLGGHQIRQTGQRSSQDRLDAAGEGEC